MGEVYPKSHILNRYSKRPRPPHSVRFQGTGDSASPYISIKRSDPNDNDGPSMGNIFSFVNLVTDSVLLHPLLVFRRRAQVCSSLAVITINTLTNQN